MGIRLGYFVGVFGMILAVSGTAQAKRIFFFDLDDTTFETREEFGGTFDTPHVLFRIDMRSNTAQALPTGPEEIEVSSNEYDTLKRHLGRGNHQPGNLNMKFRLKNGIEIVPGDYQIIAPETFEYFFSMAPNPDKPHVNYFLQQVKAAIKRSKKIGDATAWQGAAWPFIKKLLSREETIDEVRFSTARWIIESDWNETWAYLIKEKVVANAPRYELSHFVGDPKYDKYDIRGKIPKRKIGPIVELAMTMGRVPLDRPGEPHQIILVDDNQLTNDLGFRTFEVLPRGNRTNTEFGIWNIGTEAEVQASYRPRFAMINQDGTFRAASKKDLLGFEPSVCGEYFAPRQRKGK